MSTYNGEGFLGQQIESILAQEGVEVTLCIRDDGSIDRTEQIVAYYIKKHNNITFTYGDNLGVGNSFMQLVYDAPCYCDYYAFADQDDVWLPDKLLRAVNKLRGASRPMLYCSNQTLVDKHLTVIGNRYESAPDVSFEQILCRNTVSGCTMVWNEGLHALLASEERRPSRELLSKRIHDVWVAMVASVIAEIVYDEESRILYRQHENNVVGVKRQSVVRQWAQKLRNPSVRNGRSDICKTVYDNFRDLISEEHVLDSLRLYGYYREMLWMRIKLMTNRKLIKHTRESYIGFSMKVLFGLF